MHQRRHFGAVDGGGDVEIPGRDGGYGGHDGPSGPRTRPPVPPAPPGGGTEPAPPDRAPGARDPRTSDPVAAGTGAADNTVRPGARGEHTRPGLPQVAGTTLATVAAAVLASRLGVYGTVIGAGVVSLVATCGGPLLQHFFSRTGEQFRTTTGRKRPDASPGAGRTAETGSAARESGKRLSPYGEFGAATVYGTRVRGLRRPLLGAAAVFALAMGGITGYELLSGSGLGGREGTTVGSVVRGGDPGPREERRPGGERPERGPGKTGRETAPEQPGGEPGDEGRDGADTGEGGTGGEGGEGGENTDTAPGGPGTAPDGTAPTAPEAEESVPPDTSESGSGPDGSPGPSGGSSPGPASPDAGTGVPGSGGGAATAPPVTDPAGTGTEREAGGAGSR
jgi:hypothetical protein